MKASELGTDYSKYIYDGINNRWGGPNEDTMKWTSVDAKLPENDGSYLIVNGPFQPYIGRFSKGVWTDDCDRLAVKPTHWMRLPEPPQV